MKKYPYLQESPGDQRAKSPHPQGSPQVPPQTARWMYQREGSIVKGKPSFSQRKGGDFAFPALGLFSEARCWQMLGCISEAFLPADVPTGVPSNTQVLEFSQKILFRPAFQKYRSCRQFVSVQRTEAQPAVGPSACGGRPSPHVCDPGSCPGLKEGDPTDPQLYATILLEQTMLIRAL